MKSFPRFPLLAKVLCWLVLHLVILGLAFLLFVRWQLGLGLDSLLSGSAGERLAAFGDSVLARTVDQPPGSWNEEVKALADERHVTAALLFPKQEFDFPTPVPRNVMERVRTASPPQQGAPGPAPGGLRPRRAPGFGPPEGPPPEEGFPDDRPPPGRQRPVRDEDGKSSMFLPKSRPSFLLRGDHGDGYWAGILLHYPAARDLPRHPVVLLVRADHLDGSGMFFDFKPWLRGGIAVLVLSLAFWTPFVWGITRYLRRLTAAADDIAGGRFQITIPPRGNDELGNLGRTIESMAARLDHLVSGQKRFLGDAAHELCAPLARIRTGLGILESKMHGADASALASIEADAAELATLVNEILAFSRAGNREPSRKPVVLDDLVAEVLAREALDVEARVAIPEGLSIMTDPALLGRALGNLIRNASIHAGPRAKVLIVAVDGPDSVSITVSDNGPGVPKNELAHIFEPFYRIDRSRSRDSGGSGLGLAIVRSAIESCGGEAEASLPENGGFAVTLRLPKQTAGTA
jgi:two-component system sensor histidine kinase CpxA